MKRILSIAGVALALSLASGARAVPAAHAELIDGVLAQLRDYYTFPEVAEAMAAAVRAKQAAGAYDAIPEGEAIAERLTADLREVSRDGHISIEYSAEPLPEEDTQSAVPPVEEVRAWISREFGPGNYGLRRVEVLPGNIGYLKLDVLLEPHFTRQRHAAAMSLLAGTGALIVDLRDNGGAIGEGAVEEFASYFFAEPTHLADERYREGDRVVRSRTHDDIAGPKYLERPVYILTSRRTFSGAEAVASQLQEQGRAKVVGERSGGGANPGGPRRVDAHYSVWVPNGHVANAVSGGNWEGTGVTPDAAVPAQQALLAAQRLALEDALAKAPEDDAARRAALAGQLAAVERALASFAPVRFALAGHADAGEVRVAADFNHWAGAAFPLRREGDRWVGEALLAPGSYSYRFEVDGVAMPDPANPDQDRSGKRVNSILVVR